MNNFILFFDYNYKNSNRRLEKKERKLTLRKQLKLQTTLILIN